MLLYHGTANDFDKFLQQFARAVNDYYGGGLAYLTSSLQIAKGYAKAGIKRMTGKGSDPTVLTVQTSFKNTFDVDSQFTGAELQKFLPSNPKDIDAFARAAGLIKLGVDPFTVKFRLQKGTMTLKGDQIFKALEKTLGGSAKARDLLIKLGYDSLRYNGGIGGHLDHDVYIAYNAKQLKIMEKLPLTESCDFQAFLVSLMQKA